MLLVFAFTVGLISARADDYPYPDPGDFVIHDFHFENGATLPEVRIHYRTIGSLHRNASGTADNAVLVLHGTSGSGAS